ncbi:unnamed protein product, partial [Rotaria magnacalcarata]
MKRWKQQRLQNQAIQIGQALYQHNVDEVNIDPEIDDIIDINSININNTIDDPIISNVNVSESRFLNDAIDKIKQLSCNEPNIITEKDISCALVLLKKRHRLSARFMDDIISLLRTFNVPNVPSSWYRLKKSLTETQLTPIQSFICSECQELSTSSALCSQCNCHFSSANKPNYFFSFPIQNQIERILHYNRDILPTRRCYAMSITDICDGALHQKLQSRIQESFLTLTLNVDGIQPNKGSQKTIWPILLVINELPLKRRFAIENIILAGVWPGPSKPSRTEMSLFFRPLVEELITLEQGAKFQYQDDNNSSTSARIFLIGACCDKPAQALLQFLPEPIATFGCGRCEVEGFMVRTDKEGNVRSFAMTLDAVEETNLRSNMRFDVLLDLKLLHEQIQQSFPMRKRKSLVEQHRLEEKGILGPCILRELSYFDVGRSFMADTLHNVYIGAFKRLLQLWFDHDYRFQDWSISTHLSELQLIFRGLRLPSTTPRLPRCLISSSKFKANEMRILLLFGHAIFKNIIKKKYYTHFLKLVVMMHLSESREIHPSYINVISRLGKNFVINFPKLYSARHCVQVVHSVLHISDTIHDFGPVHTFTTFQYENELGLLTRITKSTRRHAQELIGYLHLIQEAYCHLNNFNFMNSNFANYLFTRFACHRKSDDSKHCQLGHLRKEDDSVVRLLFPFAHIKYYQTVHVGRIRLCIRTYAEGKVADDSNIIFIFDNVQYRGKIRSIFTIDDGEPHLLVGYIANLTPLTCEIDDTENFVYHNILFATTTKWSYVPIEVNAFVEKSIFFRSSA